MSEPKDITVKMTEREYRNFLTFKEGIKAKAEVWIEEKYSCILHKPFFALKFTKIEPAVNVIIEYCQVLSKENKDLKEAIRGLESNLKENKDLKEVIRNLEVKAENKKSWFFNIIRS